MQTYYNALSPEPDLVDEPEPASRRRRTSAHRAGRRTRFLTHEWLLAVLGSLLVAAAFTWPTLRRPFTTLPPFSTSPSDLGDPALQAWQVAWAGHALLHAPRNLWDTNALRPEQQPGHADSLLGYAPAGMLGSGFEWAVLRYNVLLVLACALAFAGGYFLVRQLGSGRLGGVVAGLAFGFAPWRAAYDGHLEALSTGGIALALAMLARGHDWKLYRAEEPEPGEAHDPDVPEQDGARRLRPGWALAGWLTATWQLTLGSSLGVPFGYLLAVGFALAAAGHAMSSMVRRRRPFSRALLLADLLGGAILAGVAALLALPYLGAGERVPSAGGTAAGVERFSVPWRGLLTAPQNNWLWGEKHAAARDLLGGGGALLPGFFLIFLAFAGTYFSVWRPRHRLFLVVGVGLSVVLIMGTHVLDGDPGYLTLSRHLPGWDAIRTPGRLVVWTTLLLAVLAAGFLTAITRRATELLDKDEYGWRRPGGLALGVATGALAVLLLVPVAAEGVSSVERPGSRTPPAALQNLTGPALILPAAGWVDSNALLWSTNGFPQLANGSSVVTPDSPRERTRSFPDAQSVAYLRQIGVRTVVWLADPGAGSEWAGVPSQPVDGLDLTREQVGNDLVFHLN